MNTEMQLFSISRKRKPDYERAPVHKVYENKFNQDFATSEINQKLLQKCLATTYMTFKKLSSLL